MKLYKDCYQQHCKDNCGGRQQLGNQKKEGDRDNSGETETEDTEDNIEDLKKKVEALESRLQALEKPLNKLINRLRQESNARSK